MPRPFRKPESFDEELRTRNALEPFLSRCGFVDIEETREEKGNAIMQTVRATDENGVPLEMAVRLCWRKRFGKSDEGFAAFQLLFRVNGADASDAIREKLEREREKGKTHWLIVNRDEAGITNAVMIPIGEVLPIWERQREIYDRLIAEGKLGSRRSNPAVNGDSPALYVQDDRAPDAVQFIFAHPAVRNLTASSYNGQSRSRNPNWTRDELILALELFSRVNPLKTNEEHVEIVALSALLNRLPIHPPQDHGSNFRNPNGVYMKLCNFLRFDPSYTGEGLTRGNKLEEEVWNEFAGNPDRLRLTADAIRTNYPEVPAPQNEEEFEADEDEEFPEGKVLTKLHKQRERNPKLVKNKKAKVLKECGNLECEVCRFDFARKYGELGFGFAECHHRKPVCELKPGEKTKLGDLAIVCANCHRMLHRRPWRTIDELRTVIRLSDN